jgi:glycosyltransferase involved in cell wall biosynthesis
MDKRVALLTNFIPPYRISLFQHLRRQLSEFRIFISTPTEVGRNWPVEWEDLPVRVQRNFSIRRSWAHPNKFKDVVTLHFPYDTLPSLLDYQPDVILCAEMGARTLQAALYRKLVRDARLIIWAPLSEITEQARGVARQMLRRRLLDGADAVIVNGASGKRYISKFGVDPRRIFEVPQTTDIAPFLSLPLERSAESRHRILISSQLIERKGLLPFLAYLSRWAHLNQGTKVELWIAGEGPLRRELASSPLPRNATVRLLGHVDYSKLSDIYAQCGVFAFPTLADEWGMVVVEAMAAGLPVLGSLYSQAVEDLISDGVNGWTFRPDRQDQVWSGLDRIFCESASKLEHMGARARNRIRNSTPGLMADQMISALDHAVRWPAHQRNPVS